MKSLDLTSTLAQLTYLDVVLPLLLLAAGILAGLLLEKVVLKYLRILARRTKWIGDEIIIGGLRGIPFFWGVALGLYTAILTVDVGDDVLRFLEGVILVAVLGSLTILAARLAAGFTVAYTRRQSTFLPATSIISNLVSVLIYITGFLLILGVFEINIAPIVTALGVGGLAVALALQDTLSNVFAGLYLIAARQIRPGDYVRLESDEEGYVTDINWRSTIVRTIFNNLIIVPNSKLASSIVTNYSLPKKEMLVIVQVAVDYESDLEQVEHVTLEVAREVLQEISAGEGYEPYVRFHTFGEFSLNLAVVMRVREFFDQYRLRHLFMKRLIVRYKAEGIRIPFPIKEFEMQLSTGGLETDEAPGLRASDAMEPVVDEDAFTQRPDPGGPRLAPD